MSRGLALLRLGRDQSLLRNSAYILATAVVTSLLGYAFWIVAARSYSPHDVGLGAALISVMTLAATVTSLGLGSTLVQALPRRATGQAWSLTVNTALVVGMLGGLVLGAGLVLSLPWLSGDFAIVREPAAGLLLLAGVVLTAIGLLLDHVFIAERAAGNMLARNLLFSVARVPLVLVPLTVAVTAGAICVLGAWVAATGASCLVGLVLVSRLGRGHSWGVSGAGSHLRSLLYAITNHHLISLGGALPVYVLPLLVAAMLSPTDNAYFYTAWMICNALFMVPYSVASALFAEGSHAAQELRRQVRTSIIVTSALLAPLVLALLVAGRPVARVLGASYAEHVVPVLTLLTLAAATQSVMGIYTSVLRVQARLRFAAALSVGTGLLMIGLTWLLLPRLGLVGAGWGVLIAYVAGALVVAVDVNVAGLRRRRRHGSLSADRWGRAL